MSDLALAAEFPKASQEAWLALVEKTLKGADFDKALATTTYDGIRIAPLYTGADAIGEAPPPGAAPYTRGAPRDADATLPWHICQSCSHPDPRTANAEILRDLERGASAVVLGIDCSGTNGIAVTNREDLAALLDGVLLDLAPVHLDAGDAAHEIAALYLAHLEDNGIDAASVNGNLGLDPIGTLARTGTSDRSLALDLAHLADTASATVSRYPQLRTASVDTTAYHLAGASEAQEIAVGLATGIAYLRVMEIAGMDLATAADQIGFTVAADADFFSTIAKLRAARTLWAEATAACGIDPAAMELRIETADRMMSRRDAWVNMLRTTVACFAAGIGGAQAVTVHPYTAASGLPDSFARRIARNTQVILQEESSLGRVLDPAGGSWYIETLTKAIAEKAWELFREIEAEGGIAGSIRSGAVQSRIAATAAARALDIARRRLPLTGVSEFPNLGEGDIDVAEVDLDAERKTAAERQASFVAGRSSAPDLSGLPDANGGALTGALIKAAKAGATTGEITTATGDAGESVNALKPHRLDEGFERLREASDRFRAANGNRPQVFLANLGSLATFTARATFAQNLFAAGGIEAITNSGFGSAADAAAAFGDSGTQLAVICSSDAVYADQAEEVAQALKGAGAEHVFLAGAPGESREKLEAAGIGTFIHSGADVLDILAKAWTHFGGPDA